MRHPQEKNDTNSIFLIRSDTLAQKLEVNVDDLPSVLGVSRASLYGYRRGKRKVSSKAWGKLESAEKEAGICKVSDEVSETKAAVVDNLKDVPLSDLLRELEKRGVQNIIRIERGDLPPGEDTLLRKQTKELKTLISEFRGLVDTMKS